MNSTKGADELQQGISRAKQEGLKEKATDESTTIPLHTLINNRKSTSSKLRDLDMQVQGVVRKKPYEYVRLSQVACTSKHTCIDKFI